MTITLRLAIRDWDFITPLVLGDVRSEKFVLEVHRVNTLVDNLHNDPRYDAGEMSLSRYSQARARGEDSIVGIPHFVMRAFRQRCIITRTDSPLTALKQLSGKKIGLTGWQDSGNTWTRALLRREGVEIEDARWHLGRLTADQPIQDRLAGFGRPGLIEPMPGERPLIESLLSGELDAVFTAFMPAGFFRPDSGLRQLQPDYRQAEIDYFREVGYVPGIHLIGIKPTIASAHPWLPGALSELLEESGRVWLDKRIKYADTTPWILDEIGRCARDLPENWSQNGFDANQPMLAKFCSEIFEQKLTKRLLTPAEMFPIATI